MAQNNSISETQPTVQPEQAPPEQQGVAGEGKDVAPPNPTPAKSARNSPRITSAQAAPPYEQVHQAAEQALKASRLLDPPEDSALFWARKAKLLNDPGADWIELQVLQREMLSVQDSMQAHNYTQAQQQVSQLAHFFPDRAEVQQMAGTVQQEQLAYTQQIEQQRRQAELDAQTKRFQFRHRHIAAFINNNTGSIESFCTGTLTVNPDGTVRYDCTSSDDPRGRCDHVTFPVGSLKEAKLRNEGWLHLASRQSGNFDLIGDANSVRQALSVIAPLVRP
jgi:hypothetical protein